MYLNITPRANNRKYLSIVHGYRDENGKVKKKTIKSLGYLDELEKKYDNPILYFKNLAKEMDNERKSSSHNISFSIKKNEKLLPGTDNTKNFGHAALSSAYHKLGIHTFLKNRQRHIDCSFNADSVFQSLVYLKLIAPFSGRKLSGSSEFLFEAPEYTENSLPHCLSFIHAYKNSMQSWIHDKVRKFYGSGSLMIYYNIFNHCSPTHMIRIGVFTDSRGLPLTFELFPCSTQGHNYRPDFSEIKNRFKTERMITVSDKGSASGNLIWEIISSPSGDGYIFSVPVHNACRELKQYMLDSTGYNWNGIEYKYKSRICPRIIEISNGNGEKIRKTIEEKQVIFYNPKYAKRARGNSFDGYYILFTSELNADDVSVVEIYRGLWENEKAFAVTKNDLEERPDPISVHDYIEINLQISLAAHILVKMLQLDTGNKYALSDIIHSLTRANCIYLQENFYVFSYYDEILRDIGKITGIPFDSKIMSLGDIKKILASVKKNASHILPVK